MSFYSFFFLLQQVSQWHLLVVSFPSESISPPSSPFVPSCAAGTLRKPGHIWLLALKAQSPGVGPGICCITSGSEWLVPTGDRFVSGCR